MKKTWIIGAAVSALLGSQGSFAASAPAGQKIDAGMLTTTPVKESTTTPRNPFSGDDTVKSVAPVSAPVVEIKIDLLEEELLSQQLSKWAQQNGYKLLGTAQLILLFTRQFICRVNQYRMCWLSLDKYLRQKTTGW